MVSTCVSIILVCDNMVFIRWVLTFYTTVYWLVSAHEAGHIYFFWFNIRLTHLEKCIFIFMPILYPMVSFQWAVWCTHTQVLVLPSRTYSYYNTSNFTPLLDDDIYDKFGCICVRHWGVDPPWILIRLPMTESLVWFGPSFWYLVYQNSSISDLFYFVLGQLDIWDK